MLCFVVCAPTGDLTQADFMVGDLFPWPQGNLFPLETYPISTHLQNLFLCPYQPTNTLRYKTMQRSAQWTMEWLQASIVIFPHLFRCFFPYFPLACL